MTAEDVLKEALVQRTTYVISKRPERFMKSARIPVMHRGQS
jgi:hypothetical protein